MRLIANQVELITLRDTASRDLLYSIGVNRPPIEITADPVFNLEAAPEDYSFARNLLGMKTVRIKKE
jgi:polysaccharide pyruvyl transferase WcaK-like protein